MRFTGKMHVTAEAAIRVLRLRSVPKDERANGVESNDAASKDYKSTRHSSSNAFCQQRQLRAVGGGNKREREKK